MKRLPFLMLLLLMLFSQSVFAEWTYLGSGDRGDKFYLDLTNIKSKGNFRKFWYMTILNTPTEYGDLSMKTQSELDCKNDNSRILYLVTYTDIDMNNISSSISNKDNTWKPVVPESAQEEMFKLVCKKK